MSSQEAEPEEGTTKGPQRHRSPNYPYVDLGKAVSRVHELHRKYKRAPAPVELVYSLWGYKPSSSGGGQCLAALKAFGLVDVEGEGKTRKVRVSDAAFRVIQKSADRSEILKKAAVAPPIHAELWEKYGGDGIPEDEILRHYLLLDRENGTFNEDSVGSAISSFRKSLEYAKLIEGDKIEDEEEGEEGVGVKPVSGFEVAEETRPQRGSPGTTPPPRKASTMTATLAVGHREDVFTLERGAVVVQWPERMSLEEVEDFESWIQILVRKVKRSAKADPPESDD